MSNGPLWIECGEKVHGLYSELLSVGSSLMRVEDHLTLGIPGADVELEETKEKLTGLVKNIEKLLVLLRGALAIRSDPAGIVSVRHASYRRLSAVSFGCPL
jgi:hypothetical protein